MFAFVYKRLGPMSSQKPSSMFFCYPVTSCGVGEPLPTSLSLSSVFCELLCTCGGGLWGLCGLSRVGYALYSMVPQPTCQTIPFAVASVRGLLCVIMDNSEVRDVIISFSQIVQCQQGSLYSGPRGWGMP